MQRPAEITLRDIELNDILKDLIQTKMADLEKTHDKLISCHVVLEKLSRRHHKGNPYAVSIDLKTRERHEIIIKEESRAGDQSLTSLIRDAFKKARVHLNELKKRQRQKQSILYGA